MGDNYWGVFYGTQGHAIVSNFTPNEDVIQLKGSPSQYSLRFEYLTPLPLYPDTGIYYGNDLIGVVQDRTDVNLFRDFVFV